MRKVILYADQGVDGAALKQTLRSLQSLLDPRLYSIQRMDAKKVRDLQWEQETALFVMPGGRDVYYQASLGKEGCLKIKDYVTQGGSYLGICAGAYFASGAIEFEKGGKFEVCAKRDLCFFPGLAKGSAYGLDKYSYENCKGAEAALISWNQKDLFAYFNGGCFFESPEQHDNVTVLSRYLHLEGTPAAVVSCNVGKGRAILSGVHLEYNAKTLSKEDPHLGSIHCDLNSSEETRKEVLKDLFLRLFITWRTY